MGEIITRFAPSPTGPLHIGGVRTALFNYAFAKKHNGKFLLRIEDTDTKRSKNEYVEDILNILSILKLNWDNKVWYQSKRMEVYKKYLEKLWNEGKVYYCFCSQEDIKRMKQEQLAMKKPPLYDGRCRKLSPKEIEIKLKENPNPAVRFKLPDNIKSVEFYDIIRGKISIPISSLEDFVIYKPDKTPAYNFAVVIDDALMNITHVIRGEEHITNTAKQILLYNALGFNLPQFAHLPLIMKRDGGKLSKRAGDTTVRDLLNDGFLPEAILNFTALLGWSPPDGKEIFTLHEFVSKFDLKRVSKASAIYDNTKLIWLNSKHLHSIETEDLWRLVKKYISPEFLKSYNKEKWLWIVESVKDNLTKLSDINRYIEVYFKYNYSDFNLSANIVKLLDKFKNFIRSLSEEKFKPETIKIELKNFLKEVKEKKDFLLSLRRILTGQKSGPGIEYVIAILGKEEVLKRVDSIF